MQRIATATRSVALFGPGKDGFTEGNVLSGLPATSLSAEWFNAVQEEIAAVIEGAGIALNGASNTQLLSAIQQIAAGAVGAVSSIRVPPGTVSFYAGPTAPPAGWLKCNGAALSRTVYADLYAVIGVTYGAGVFGDQFQVPDLRGEFVRGWDDGRNVDPGRSFGSWQADQFRSHSHRFKSGADSSSGSDDESNSTDLGNWQDGWIEATGGSETRPRNIALHAIIKY